jgi:hypothetical protein
MPEVALVLPAAAPPKVRPRIPFGVWLGLSGSPS